MNDQIMFWLAGAADKDPVLGKCPMNSNKVNVWVDSRHDPFSV